MPPHSVKMELCITHNIRITYSVEQCRNVGRCAAGRRTKAVVESFLQELIEILVAVAGGRRVEQHHHELKEEKQSPIEQRERGRRQKR